MVYLLGIALFFIWEGQCIAEQWKELNGTHFSVYYMGEEKFARDTLEEAEVYYNRIASDLGYQRYQEFWLWEKRCKIYIYSDHQSFLRASGGQPEWSHGMAVYKTRKILSYAWHQNFLDSLLPHEIAHLVFRDFVGSQGEIPLWLDEGVAQWEEQSGKDRVKRMAKELYNQNGLFTISDMMSLDISTMRDQNRVYIRSALTKDGDKGVVFLSTNNLVNTYYIQSVSLIGFLMERFGAQAFAAFCRELRDGKNVEEALRSTYPSLPTMKDFENQWKTYLDNQ
ncbi:MAG: hypothetical protein HY209_06605 [Candidatus Omnitrophica bacterium]|nr:hypothetical protein [Candidatus Omnitrophota bacterium]